MIWCHQGSFTWLQEKVPTLVNTHCVAHCEALVTSDAFKVVSELLILDDFGWFCKQGLYLGRKELQLTKGIEKPHGFIWLVAINHPTISSNPLAFSRSSFGKNFVLHANYTLCFSNIRNVLLSSSYHLSISIHASSCGWCLGGVE